MSKNKRKTFFTKQEQKKFTNLNLLAQSVYNNIWFALMRRNSLECDLLYAGADDVTCFPSEVAAAQTLEPLDWVDTLGVTVWFVRFVYLLCII